MKLNEKYEEQLHSFLHVHPFLERGQFRNAVFEAAALALVMRSETPEHRSSLAQYGLAHKRSYHLVYLLDAFSSDNRVASEDVHLLVGSALEFRSLHSTVELSIEGQEDPNTAIGDGANLDLTIEISLGKNGSSSTKTYTFNVEMGTNNTLALGARLATTFVTVPYRVSMGGADEIEISSPVEIDASEIELEARRLVMRAAKQASPDVILRADVIESELERLSTDGCDFSVVVPDTVGTTYPLVQHVRTKHALPPDPDLREKYIRIRRILLEFRSHSRGQLAKYKDKIEHDRVLRNEIGRRVLRALIDDGVLELRGRFYFLDPDGLDEHLGVSWQDLRRGLLPSQLLDYLRRL